MNKVIRHFVCFLVLVISASGFADTGVSCDYGGLCNYTPQTGGNGTNGNIGHHMPGSGMPSGSGIAGGPTGKDLIAKRTFEAYGLCKNNVYSRVTSCNKNAHSNHARDSIWCSSAKWVGAAVGVAAGWEAVQGEGGATVLLGGTAAILIAKGDHCQTDMDRILSVNLSICDVDFNRDNDYCESIKP